MTVTKETRVATRDDDCTTLTEAERYSVEAGSYLALVKPDSGTSAHQPGEKIVSFDVDDDEDLDGYSANTVVTDFTPDVSGVYVFRRSIGVANDKTETFKYDSYYYDATTGKYYKTALTSITPDTVADYAGDNVRTDGNLSDAAVTYFKDVPTVVTPKLTYDAAGHKLIATVEGTSYIDDEALENAGKAYDKALHDYEVALAEQTRALAEDTAANGTLKAALDTLNADKIAEAAAKKDFEEALANYKAIQAELKAAQDELGTASDATSVAGKNAAALKALFGDSYTSDSAPSGYDTWDGDESESYHGLWEGMKDAYDAKEAADDASDAFLADLQAWITNSGLTTDNALGNGTYNESDDLGTLIDKMSYAKLQDFKAWIAGQPDTSEKHHEKLLEADYYIAKKAYDDKVAEFKITNALYNSLKGRVGDDSNGLTEQLATAKTNLVGSDTSLDTLLDDPDATYSSIMTAANSAVGDLDDSDTPSGNTDFYSKWKDAAIATAIAQTAYDAADTAANDNNASTSVNLAAANAAVANARAQLDLASALYNDAVTEYNAAHDIIVNINLANDVTEGGTAEKWQILPSTVADDEAVFYYTSILEGGETSAKLIESVTLDPSVTQDMYKYFDFDLNVALKSAQVTYADDNETILATATTSELGKTATLTDPTNIDTALTWN